MEKSLDKKIILITGASSGIGRATALVCAQAGATVILADLDSEKGEEALSRVLPLSRESLFHQMDVSDETSVKETINRITEKFGRLDGAFNNAGIEFVAKKITDLTLDEWSRSVSVNQTGVFLCLKYELEVMLKQRAGSIVNTSSACGVVAIPWAAEYVATKHGVVGLTKAAAADCGEHGIRVNAVLPGSVETPMIRRLLSGTQFGEQGDSNVARHLLKRYGKPEEIGEAVKWLLSDAATFVTGAVMPVDGGYLAN